VLIVAVAVSSLLVLLLQLRRVGRNRRWERRRWRVVWHTR
jgi:hypothetical protein